jgi:hypothetical protein
MPSDASAGRGRLRLGKADLCDRTPRGFLHVRHADTLLSQCDDLGLQVVAHEMEFVPFNLFGGMNGQFCRRQREDQPLWPASTEASPSTSRQKARSAAASLLERMTCAPKITDVAFLDFQRSPCDGLTFADLSNIQPYR